MSKNLAKQLALVVSKKITYGKFVEETREEFVSMAKHLMRRWTPPAWMQPEELVQELYLGAWMTMFGKKPFDPSRGKTLKQYVVWNAMNYAKRALHRARGAKLSGTEDKNPSHIEKPLSSLGAKEGDGEDYAEKVLAQDPIAEELLIREEHRREAIDSALTFCTCASERVAILAIAETGDVDLGGRLLYEDIDTRHDLRLGSEEHAIRYVVRAAKAVSNRIDAAPAS